MKKKNTFSVLSPTFKRFWSLLATNVRNSSGQKEFNSILNYLSAVCSTVQKNRSEERQKKILILRHCSRLQLEEKDGRAEKFQQKKSSVCRPFICRLGCPPPTESSIWSSQPEQHCPQNFPSFISISSFRAKKEADMRARVLTNQIFSLTVMNHIFSFKLLNLLVLHVWLFFMYIYIFHRQSYHRWPVITD